MTTRKPPKLAAWLLQSLGGNGPLAGDLREDFQNGRSTGWYWRQSLWAVASGLGRGFWVLRFYFLAFSLGFAAQAAVAFVLWRLSWPPQLHGWPLAAVWVLYAAWLSEPFWNPWRKRGDSQQRRCSSTDAPFDRELAGFIASVTFTLFFTLYVVNALLSPRDSLGSWIMMQAIWFVISVALGLRFTGRITRPGRRRQA